MQIFLSIYIFITSLSFSAVYLSPLRLIPQLQRHLALTPGQITARVLDLITSLSCSRTSPHPHPWPCPDPVPNIFTFFPSTAFFSLFLTRHFSLPLTSSPLEFKNLGSSFTFSFFFFKKKRSIVDLQCYVSFRCIANIYIYIQFIFRFFSLIGYYKILSVVPCTIQ